MKGDKAGKKIGGYLLLEILICMLLFSVVVFVISVFLKRTVMIEKKKSKTQKLEENIHFLTDKISEDISNRDREVFEYEGGSVLHNNFNDTATKNKGGNLICNNKGFDEERKLYERIIAMKEEEIAFLRSQLAK